MNMSGSPQLRVRNELLLINLHSLVLILVTSILDVRALQVVLGLPFVLFFPGYTLVATLLPKRSDLGTTERVALSVGFSIFITALTGLILGLVWEIRLYPILISLTALTAALSGAAWYRRRGYPEEERPVLAFGLPFRNNGHRNALDVIVSIALALAMVGTIGTLAYTFASPRVGERFTEFYMLGAESLPRELTVGHQATVTLGIKNDEHGTMNYDVEALMGKRSLPGIGPVQLDSGQKWEGEYSLTPPESSARTQLAEEVTIPPTTPVARVTTIEVGTVSGFEPGDQIMVGEESALVQALDNQTMVLEDGLMKDHPVGTEVIEMQKVEFRLFKNYELSDSAGTTLSLWVGKQTVVAHVGHRSGSAVTYRIDATTSGGQSGDPVVESVMCPPNQADGDTWTSQIDYPFSEMNRVQFSLYENDELLYRTSESEPYPSVYLWVVVE